MFQRQTHTEIEKQTWKRERKMSWLEGGRGEEKFAKQLLNSKQMLCENHRHIAIVIKVCVCVCACNYMTTFHFVREIWYVSSESKTANAGMIMPAAHSHANTH